MTAPGGRRTWSCPTCGTTNDAAIRLCTVCGLAPAAGAPSVPIPTTTNAPPPAWTAPPTPSAGGSGQQFGVVGIDPTVTGCAPAAASPATSPSADGGGNRAAVLIATCVVVVAALIGATIVLLDRSSDDNSSSSASRPSTTSPVDDDRSADGTLGPTASLPSTTTTPTTILPATTVDPITTASQALEQIRATDRSQVEALTGSWVPQISSKRVGLAADGIIYDAPAILAKHRRLTVDFAYDDIGLLWSGDYSTFKDGRYWVSITLTGYSTADGANAWCSQAGLGSDDCFAKLLSHTAPAAGSTKNR